MPKDQQNAHKTEKQIIFTFFCQANLCQMPFLLFKCQFIPGNTSWASNFGKVVLPMRLIVKVKRSGLVHLLQLLPVSEVQGKVGGDDGFADDLEHLLILTGAQRGENVMPFQLRET
jgi:hypothetical protein